MRERERERVRMSRGEEVDGKGDADFPLSREPDMGLDPRTLRSQPEPKADTLLTEPSRHP